MTLGKRAAELAGLAAAVLGWRPREFWESTPAELASALGFEQGGEAAIDREAVDRLLTQFPDERTD
jgi:uncharacterized phage protein (TIGR02216 family)